MSLLVAEFKFSPFCPFCRAAIGQLHKDGCIAETCSHCGHLRVLCDCRALSGNKNYFIDNRLPWDGSCFGQRECLEFGWFAKEEGRKMVRCGPDEPGAMLDLERILVDAKWSRKLKRWVKRKKAGSGN